MGLTSSKISTKRMVPICRQLATSYEAGIPIVRALALVGDSSRDHRTKQVLLAMKELIERGSTLGDAARTQRKYLPDYFIELLATGESGGRLDVMLRDLAQYYEDRLVMTRKFIGSLVYPGLQLMAAWYLGTFALGLIGGLDLGSTRAFNLGTYFDKYLAFHAVVLVCVGILVAVCVVLARMGLFGWVWGWFATYVWPVRPITLKFGLARFFRSMSLLIGSGMNIRHCIENSAKVTNNPYLQRDLLQAAPRVAQGETLVSAFSSSRQLSPMARQMLAVGEESGNLEGALRKVSEYHFEEATHAVRVATKFLGVGISLGIGGLVGYIVISFYSQYANLLNSF